MAILLFDDATGPNGTDIGTRGYNPGGGGFCSIQGNEYELTWAGSGVWRARYATPIKDDDFEFSAKVRRPPTDVSHNTGIMFWYREDATVQFCYLFMQRKSAALVDFEFHRYDGGYQDPAILEADVPVPADGQVLLGCRMVGGAATAFRAAADGSGEVDLGPLAISVDWRDGNHRMFGIGNNFASVSRTTKWDDILVRDWPLGTNWTPPDPPMGLTAWGNC